MRFVVWGVLIVVCLALGRLVGSPSIATTLFPAELVAEAVGPTRQVTSGYIVEARASETARVLMASSFSSDDSRRPAARALLPSRPMPGGTLFQQGHYFAGKISKRNYGNRW